MAMDERIFSTSEALKILRKHYITDEIQMVTRYIRSGNLKAEKDTRKDGYRIREEDLYEFIEKEKPGMIEVIYTYEKYIEQLRVKSEPEKYIKVLLSKKHDSDKPATTSKRIVDEDGTFEMAASKHPLANQKIDQVVSVTSESFPTKPPSNDWINELFAHPSFQTKLSEWSKANPTNQAQSKTNKEKSRNKHKYQKLSYDKFLDMLNNQKTGKKVLDLYSDEQLEFVHTCYFENGQMREELYDNQRNPSVFICPVSKKEKNQWLYLLVVTQPEIEKAFEASKSSGDRLSSGESDLRLEGDTEIEAATEVDES